MDNITITYCEDCQNCLSDDSKEMDMAKCKAYPEPQPKDNIGQVRIARQYALELEYTYQYCEVLRKHKEGNDICKRFLRNTNA